MSWPIGIEHPCFSGFIQSPIIFLCWVFLNDFDPVTMVPKLSSISTGLMSKLLLFTFDLLLSEYVMYDSRVKKR